MTFLLSACNQENTPPHPPSRNENKSENESKSEAEGDKFLHLGPIDIEVIMTPKATQQLIDTGEKIKILLYVSHDSSEGPVLGELEKFLPPQGGISHIDKWKVPSLQPTMTSYSPYTLINVVSSRDHCEFNLLSCSIYSDTYPKTENTKIAIKCDVIRDVPHCREKQFHGKP